jgi:hypothetical protein
MSDGILVLTQKNSDVKLEKKVMTSRILLKRMFTKFTTQKKKSKKKIQSYFFADIFVFP